MVEEIEQENTPKSPKGGPQPQDRKGRKQLIIDCSSEQHAEILRFINFRTRGGHSPDYGQSIVDIIQHVDRSAFKTFKTR